MQLKQLDKYLLVSCACVVILLLLWVYYPIIIVPYEPMHNVRILATWGNGRKTLSQRIGDAYYTWEDNGTIWQHTGKPEAWKYE